MKRRGNLCCEVRKLLSGVRRYTEMCVSVAVRDTPTVNPLTQDVTMCETVRWSPIQPEQSAFPCNKKLVCFSSVKLAAAQVTRLPAVVGPEPGGAGGGGS